ncbi:ATP-binding cassette domain-containing protein [Paenibacillus sp. J2TS4]|uniref:ABC transporter ATP-binding protein n=1 Tax=Paenibacillus sp. J2TS4 TaxID=2807194 RepID=UPI001B218A3D|nr:ATP-binding cassette domain-containing protein [Paenibacillus sp. J2TS4]GIP31221.1 ABC transporter ATP-binding protein [Paenibacillus sp. J2TS4]
MKIIRVEGLSKRFARKMKQEGLLGSFRSLVAPQWVEKVAVHPIDFTVEAGEVLAFLGPNGAGKSTTIKMLTGILHPTSGYAEVLGHCPWQERQKLAYRIGSVFGQKSQLWYHLPPADSFELMSRIYELGRNDYRKRRDELIDRLGLSPYLLVPVRKLSLGERMRCELAAALLHRPRLLFLDEPTIGLDVIAKQKIREAIREMNREEGTTIFITSHDAGDVEQLCSRAVIINDGRIILDDPVSVMKRDYLTMKRITLELRTEPTVSPSSRCESVSGRANESETAGRPFRRSESEALELPGVELIEREGKRLRLGIHTNVITVEEVLGYIVRHYELEDVTIEDPPMEEVISHIYERSGKEAG